MLRTSDDLLSVFQTLVNLGYDLFPVFQTLVNLGYLVMPIVGQGSHAKDVLWRLIFCVSDSCYPGLPGDAHCGAGFPCCGRPVTTYYLCFRLLLTWATWWCPLWGRVPVLWTSCDDLLSVFQTLVNLGYLVMPIVGQGSRAVDVLWRLTICVSDSC